MSSCTHKPYGLICSLFLHMQLWLNFSFQSLFRFSISTVLPGLFYIHQPVPPSPSLPLYCCSLSLAKTICRRFFFDTKSKPRTAHKTYNRNKRHINCYSSSKTCSTASLSFSISFSISLSPSRLVHRTLSMQMNHFCGLLFNGNKQQIKPMGVRAWFGVETRWGE